MKKIAVILFFTFLVGACSGPGKMVSIPLTMPKGEKATLVAHNQQVPEWLLNRDELALNYIVKGEVSNEQLMAVSKVEKACRIYTEAVRPSNLVMVISNGVLYGAAGFIGLNLGSRAFGDIPTMRYGQYGAGATGVAGIANGIIMLGGQTYTFESCSRETFGVFANYDVRVIQKSPY